MHIPFIFMSIQGENENIFKEEIKMKAVAVLCLKESVFFSFSLLEIHTVRFVNVPTELNTHSYSFIFIIQWRAIFLHEMARDGLVGPFHHCRLSHGHQKTSEGFCLKSSRSDQNKIKSLHSMVIYTALISELHKDIFIVVNDC